jgi:tRNA(Ile2) C34 agmatinyltransferase TiaS
MIGMLIVVGALAATAALAFALDRLRRPRVAVYHTLRCPSCGQKVRFAAERAGATAKCPRCRARCDLPTTLGAAAPADGRARPQVGQRLGRAG